MPKPVCVDCRCFYRPKKNAIGWIEGMPKTNASDIRGHRSPGSWEPYKLWVSDMWECPDCAHQIIVGHAMAPISEHYRPDFHDEVQRHDATIQINDC